ncbi:hypothetical protein TPHA_0F01250 [Tetrapisispora phaffii CBS 4417]|uniref:Nucleoporin Nup159/Nup146 N-terminal domain-containing protein n=1 Tax=Tetrapisispora phaffii (strain ATCC 24235 / CBS 4417 / NBRC 1672 / NRRL Y-8282 / UCD 70-5) TaxID=1071381 RepID=G8BV28_TETPH|nr:hypothetical protein TPHA_0F01250 [Tetrapisispora phaffii CBS 4417]CCE63610.1 hypothetical protein TPHA_0F01250 [Tetrapisispora phaffii CBS 4417]
MSIISNELETNVSDDFGFKALGLKNILPPYTSNKPYASLQNFDISNERELYIAATGNKIVVGKVQNLREFVVVDEPEAEGIEDENTIKLEFLWEDDVENVIFVKFTTNHIIFVCSTGELYSLDYDNIQEGKKLLHTLSNEIRDMKIQHSTNLLLLLLKSSKLLCYNYETGQELKEISDNVLSFDITYKKLALAFSKEDSKQIKLLDATNTEFKEEQSIDYPTEVIEFCDEGYSTVNVTILSDSQLLMVLDEVYDRLHEEDEISYDQKMYVIDLTLPEVSFKESFDITPAFGSVLRVPTLYNIILNGLIDDKKQLNVIGSSCASELTIIDESGVLQPSQDGERAILPINKETDNDTNPIGIAIDISSSGVISDPCMGVDKIDQMALIYILTDDGSIIIDGIYDSKAMKEGKYNIDNLKNRLHTRENFSIEEATKVNNLPTPEKTDDSSLALKLDTDDDLDISSKLSLDVNNDQPDNVKSHSIFENPAFGSTGFGSTDSKPAFGSTGFGSTDSKPAFGSTGFGSTDSKPAFGSTGFGSTDAKPAFGSTGFGSTDSKPAFGSTGFGSTDSKPAFGSTGFGSTDSKPAFGSTGFGSTDKKSPFAGTAFGTTGTKSLFGTSSFGQLSTESNKQSPFAKLSLNKGNSDSIDNPFLKPTEQMKSNLSIENNSNITAFSPSKSVRSDNEGDESFDITESELANENDNDEKDYVVLEKENPLDNAPIKDINEEADSVSIKSDYEVTSDTAGYGHEENNRDVKEDQSISISSDENISPSSDLSDSTINQTPISNIPDTINDETDVKVASTKTMNEPKTFSLANFTDRLKQKTNIDTDSTALSFPDRTAKTNNLSPFASYTSEIHKPTTSSFSLGSNDVNKEDDEKVEDRHSPSLNDLATPSATEIPNDNIENLDIIDHSAELFEQNSTPSVDDDIENERANLSSPEELIDDDAEVSENTSDSPNNDKPLMTDFAMQVQCAGQCDIGNQTIIKEACDFSMLSFEDDEEYLSKVTVPKRLGNFYSGALIDKLESVSTNVNLQAIEKTCSFIDAEISVLELNIKTLKDFISDHSIAQIEKRTDLTLPNIYSWRLAEAKTFTEILSKISTDVANIFTDVSHCDEDASILYSKISSIIESKNEVTSIIDQFQNGLDNIKSSDFLSCYQEALQNKLRVSIKNILDKLKLIEESTNLLKVYTIRNDSLKQNPYVNKLISDSMNRGTLLEQIKGLRQDVSHLSISDNQKQLELVKSSTVSRLGLNSYKDSESIKISETALRMNTKREIGILFKEIL